MRQGRFCLVLALACAPIWAQADVHSVQFTNKDRALTFEVLTDRIFHFEYSSLSDAPHPQTDRIKTTPFVEQSDMEGPDKFSTTNSSFQTAFTQVTVDSTSLCFTVFDSFRQELLTRVCPLDGGVTLDQLKMQNVYGLGEQFQTPGAANGDWIGKTRTPGDKYGNALSGFNGGYTGNAQFPVMYALGPNSLNYAFYVDTVYPLAWDFTTPTWKVSRTRDGSDPAFRGYFILGDDLPMLRENYMSIVGHPLVPPKKAFGLWVSEFGYKNWGEVDDKLRTLRQNHFPVDGFVLDLYWFGGYESSSPDTHYGAMEWDTINFPDPKGKIAHYAQDEGVGLMPIEHGYVGQNRENFASMASRGYMVRMGCASCDPTILDSWWGKGGMIDWTNPAARLAWATEHRKKALTDLGVTFHWTDLGEPESYNDDNYYSGLQGTGHLHADVHNAYNFLWDEGIFEGYEANRETQRHFIVSRSGGPGLQRFGAAMWSGDIGSNLKSLAAHMNVQMHLSMSGIDYFGADVGGFHREALEGDVNEVYTKWFANASMFDVPIRPHTDNGSKKNNTPPDRIGDVASNLYNLRQRYELAPYYYTLAYRAWLFGEPLLPPVFYYFQNDLNARTIGDEKMIGHDLLAASTTQLGEQKRNVYLPAGDWADYHTGTWFHSQGQWYSDFSFTQNGVFHLPLFARAGAIIPKAHVDDQTMNILGKRSDGTQDTQFIVRVYASRNPSDFNVIEDDGQTESYRRSGAYAVTEVQQKLDDESEVVTVLPRLGMYDGAPSQRTYTVELALDGKKVSRVLYNDQILPFAQDADGLSKLSQGWTLDTTGLVVAKVGSASASEIKKFVFQVAP